MRINSRIGSTERLVEVFNKLNKTKLDEAIVQQVKGKYYQNPEYNGGQREEIEIPFEYARNLLNDPNYEFKLETTGGVDNRSELFFNGNFGDFLIIIANNGKTYVAHIHENDYMELKNRFSNNMGESVEVNNEQGTDSAIFQMLFAYVSKNRISSYEFQVGELTVQILANPTTWDESPYSPATHMQPEEGGYPENVQGEINDIVIWDREDNEYKLSNDALERLNQNVQFDGEVLDDITEKAANGGEDEYSRADFARKDSMTEGFIKEYEADDFSSDIELFISTLEQQGVDYQNASPVEMWQTFENQFEEGSEFNEFKGYWDKLTKNPNQTNMFESEESTSFKFGYFEGNFVPKGYEDKKIGLRSVYQPIGSDNNKILIVSYDDNGGVIDILDECDDWDCAKSKLGEYLN